MKRQHEITRRQALKMSLGLAAAMSSPAGLVRVFAATPPTAPVAIGKCATYDEGVVETLAKLFDTIGGIGSLVKGKSVCVKVNLTGDPRTELGGLPANRTYHTHPDVLHATCALLGKAGAKRITIVESLLFTQPKEEVFGWAGWDLSALRSAAKDVRFEDTRNKGSGGGYARVKVPTGGFIYPAYDLNKAYVDVDVCVSIAKMKDHTTAGVTLALKNLFGIAPNSIYSDDAGSEDAHSARGILHTGRRKAATDIEEIDPDLPRRGGYRVPRVVVDLVGVRPIDLAIIDAIETSEGGEGPWCRRARPIKPGVLLVGRNAVCTDAVSMAVMGYDPDADRDTPPFVGCDNHLKLAASVGLGTNKLSEIEVRGVPLSDAKHPFDPSLRSRYSKRLERMFIR